ncbi:MAG: chorismate synthase [Limnochordia bacterium]|jgi:chorismate synthase
MLRYVTAGESHGSALVAIITGMPACVELLAADIDHQLSRRQRGYGRGGRMRIEHDRVQILSGVRGGRTLGSPIALQIENRDWTNWQECMAPGPGHAASHRRVTCPRPGHADLAGLLKYGHRDIRNVLERASARETAARVAAGAVARCLLRETGVVIYSHVLSIGDVRAAVPPLPPEQIAVIAEANDVACADQEAAAAMRAAIDAAKEAGDTLGGVFEVIVEGLPPGLGSYAQWDERLDGRLARALMSVQAIKGVEIGLGFASARQPGSLVHDPIAYEAGRYIRLSNHAGGLEGGMSNGEALILRAAMKPIGTLYQPLPSVDIDTKEEALAAVERSDTCAVPAAAVVGEAVVAFEVGRALLEKFGGDSVGEVCRNLQGYLDALRHA